MYYELRHISGLVERWGEDEELALTDAHAWAILRGAQLVRVDANVETVVCDVEDDTEADADTEALKRFLLGE